METKWYENDWVIGIVAQVVWIMTVIGNYIYHGGRLVW